LEGIIRDPESIGQLRGRAQWLIGETYFLQERFAEAIDAYRRVEGIDPDGAWVAAALVQAGKSFEQLGRTQEASVCYWTLIRRFADSPHSQAARTRMASLSPNGSAQNAIGQDIENSLDLGTKLRR
jgi:TolA-binding protein